MALSPLDLISARPWHRAVFTTYALSLSFFEAVLLDALVRGGGREALILADIEGVRAGLSEQGARRVGRDYEVEPISVTSGVFHPKLSALVADDECHLLVGSGNLTFNGWGGNLEVVEHLHPGFAADAIDDAADFFELLALADNIRHGAADLCQAVANDLRKSTRGRARNGDIRLFHSLDGAISGKIAEAVDGLGGATRLVAAAPFWDSGKAISRLCEAIGLDHVFIHAHSGGTVQGKIGSNWPSQTSVEVRAVELEVLKEEKPRKLHAKAFEIICRRGRLLVSGSPNASTAALGAGRNVEACVARMQRNRTVGWTYVPSSPPQPMDPVDDADDGSAAIGILRAVLEGDHISGQVISPAMTGAASVCQVTAEGPRKLDDVDLAADGSFTASAPGLEVQSWKGGRLVVRVEASDGSVAEGFVSLAAFTEMTRRAGPLGPRLLAILAGTETPADVAAMMSWFHEDPRRMTQAAMPIGGGSAGERASQEDLTVAVSDLRLVRTSVPGADRPSAGGAGWVRFMGYVFAALREKRGPLEQVGAVRNADSEEEGDVITEEVQAVDRAVDHSLAVFEQFLDKMLSPGLAELHAFRALDLTQYICERLQPDQQRAKGWLQRLLDALTRIEIPDDRRELVSAVVLTLVGTRIDENDLRAARSRLVGIRADLHGDCPSPELARGFHSVLPQSAAFPELWDRVRRIRTYREQARYYLDALAAGHPADGYGELALAAKDEFATMADAFKSERSRKKIDVMKQWSEACPKCHRTLPKIEVGKLRSTAVATARNCCGHVLIWPEEAEHG
ncbi:hypothetical protein EN805_00015 [bacterium M00.F.Ca.ET.162.01.1.1]|nr:hypothetical protein EN848_08620 [bacterium M00.F.Ca.ET.205.01.1.1]TGZ44757.1 hypothetical protein EN805_00015 [bacterium M00.F.Ca.ET.162.01.1.1]